MVDVAVSVDASQRGRGLARHLLDTVAFAVHSVSASAAVTLGVAARCKQDELRAEFGAAHVPAAHEVVTGIRIEAERPSRGRSVRSSLCFASTLP